MSEHERNKKVVGFAEARLGQRVGKAGECWDLAQQALEHAGAKTWAPKGRNEDYVWGNRIELKSAIPGDILQFRNHVAVTTVETDITFDDGSGTVDTKVSKVERPHHTAIVAANKWPMLMVFEQNVRPAGRIVQRNSLIVTSVKSTTKTSTRNVRDSSGRVRPAKVVETTTITVKGWIRGYRPQAKK